MEQLIELVNIVSKNKAKNLDTVSNFQENESKLQALYSGIAEGKFASDSEAARFIYPDSPRQHVNYGKIKRRLYQRLINSIFFIDINKPDYDDLQTAYYTCYRDFAALKILIGRSALKTAVPLGESILKRAQKFEFTDLVVNVLRELHMIYAGPQGDQKNFVRCNKLLKSYTEIFQAEILAEEYYHKLAIHFTRSRATKPELAATASQYKDNLVKLGTKAKTYRYILMAYLVMSLRYQIVNDYKNTLRVCKEAVSQLKKKGKAKSKTSLYTFQIKMASCQIQLGEFEESQKTLELCLNLVDKGVLNWYVTNEYLLISLFHSGNYQKALKVFVEAQSLPAFKSLPAHYQEQWAILETYIHFFIANGAITPDRVSLKKLGRFKLSKFLNDVPVFSKDKRGSNITILVLQILFLIQQKRFGDVSDRLESLKAYSYRYLRKDDTFRSNCFIHMLQQLPKAFFNKKAIGRHANKYRQKLKSVPLDLANQSGEVELVPYEKLWSLVIASLKG